MCTVEHRSALPHVGEATEVVDVIAIEPCNERLGIVYLGIVLPCGPCTHRMPFACGPRGALHLATLGHLQAVERVAVRPEQPCHEEVPSTILAPLTVELLPPTL